MCVPLGLSVVVCFWCFGLLGVGAWLLAHVPCFLLSAPCFLFPGSPCILPMLSVPCPMLFCSCYMSTCSLLPVYGVRCRFPCAHAPCSMFTGRCISSLVSRLSHLISIVSLVHDSIDGLLKQTSALPFSSFSTQSRRGWVWRPEET